MAEEHVQSSLGSNLAVDVVSTNRLMGADQKETLVLLSNHDCLRFHRPEREILVQAITTPNREILMKFRSMFTAMLVLGLMASISTVPGTARADAVADFYKGRTISLFIGYGVGGGYDAYSRILARHWGKYIPGNPNIVPKNMPGAGSLKVANYIANAAHRDGTQIGVFASSTALEPLFGSTKAKFKTTDFTWIGSMNKSFYGCGVWKSTGMTKFFEMQNSPVIFGSTGPAAVTSIHAKVLKNMLGAKLRIIYGYKGTKGINLAMRRGEVNASCGLTGATLESRWKQDVVSGDLRPVIQFSKSSVPAFGDAVNVYDLVKNDADRQVADIIFRQGEVGRPVAGTPGVPAARAAALKKAFMATMKDPGFLADAKKIRLVINPIGGDEVVELFRSFLAYPVITHTHYM